MVRIGFIGLGKMGSALITALIEKGMTKPHEVTGADKIDAALELAARTLKINVTKDVAAAVAASEVIFLSVKPQDVDVTVRAFEHAWTSKKILISICAGVQLCTLEALLGPKSKVVRVMPNAAAMAGAMAAGFAPNSNITPVDAAFVGKILNCAGLAKQVTEDLLNSVTGLSGSGPAYVAYLIREFAKAGEKVGLEPDIAYKLALHTFYGSSKMLADKKITPDQLITIVTSPKGTTWAGRQVLEHSDVSDVLLRTVIAGTERSKELGAAAAAATRKLKAKL
ncbi:pyrroline-5-carboxylate reductase, mitochondrial [Pelomyxa schiedti]|nr:pyrroline-5-carboxylate reductase, mitochondrial [Pelomyxa schiedti]